MIKEWLESYQPQNKEDAEFALREIMQEIALAGLYRAGFFEKAAFYGGTALRIFHGLPRFSEDLDFTLLREDGDFKFDQYLSSLQMEFEALGIKVSLRRKEKSVVSNIDSAFLKADTFWREVVLEASMPSIGLNEKTNLKIKIEVDTRPPLGFETESLLLLKPFSCYINCLSLPDLFAGKMHALLFRKWKSRVKGRDWFDFEWYVKKGVCLGMAHLGERAFQSGDLSSNDLSSEQFLDLLLDKIKNVSFNQIREDVVRFIPNPASIDIWSEQYFVDLTRNIKLC